MFHHIWPFYLNTFPIPSCSAYYCIVEDLEARGARRYGQVHAPVDSLFAFLAISYLPTHVNFLENLVLYIVTRDCTA
jgi:hypothetical protein